MNTIVFRTTNECNLRCTYCYDNNNHEDCISKKIATDNFANNMGYILDDCLKIYGNNRKPNFIFHGGEPLLVDTKLLDEFCTELYKKRNVKFSIQTNGTLINEQAIDFFRKHHVGVGISLDGANEKQNAARIFKNGSTSFKTVLAKTELLKKAGIDFGIVMSISKLHMGCEQELYEFLADHKFNCNIRPVYPSASGNNDVVMTSDEYLEFFRNLFDIWFNDEEKRVDTYQINEFAKALTKGLIPRYSEHMCECSPNCFLNFISLDVLGNLYACNRLYNVEDFYYGNIRNMSMEEVYKIAYKWLEERNKAIKEKCGDCKMVNNCYGGCPAESYGVTGSILEPSVNCEIKKGVSEYVKQKVLSLGRIN